MSTYRTRRPRAYWLIDSLWLTYRRERSSYRMRAPRYPAYSEYSGDLIAEDEEGWTGTDG